MRKVLFILVFVIIMLLLGRNLNPFSPSMFEFHDITQPARIQQFALDLKNLQIPPRMAPNFSFGLGYPVFNFYAPASYWITSIFSLMGTAPVNALKLSFILTLAIAFLSSFLFLKDYFDFYPSLVGAVSYITSLYFAIDIYVRGNLAETWFLALLPATFYVLSLNSRSKNRWFFIFTVFVLFLILTVHNLLSLLSLPVLIIFVLLLKNKKRNLLSIVLALLLGSFFFVPLFLESSLTYAQQVAKMTHYQDHFLCAYQLWQSPWGYGASLPGCNDGMSFKVGKLQIIMFLVGLIIFIIPIIRRVSRLQGSRQRAEFFHGLFFIVLTLSSLFLTTYQSQFFWDLTSPISSVIQFPWRLIAFSLVGIAFFVSFFMQKAGDQLKKPVAFLVIIAFLFFSYRYYYHPPIAKGEFEQKYLSSFYIENQAAQQIAEYLPKTADYKVWRGLEGKQAVVNNQPKGTALPITYFPYWTIIINNQKVIPTVFDALGRPIIKLIPSDKVKLQYKQTPVEKIGDFISILSVFLLILIIANKSIWRKII